MHPHHPHLGHLLDVAPALGSAAEAAWRLTGLRTAALRLLLLRLLQLLALLLLLLCSPGLGLCRVQQHQVVQVRRQRATGAGAGELPPGRAPRQQLLHAWRHEHRVHGHLLLLLQRCRHVGI